jgi:hypothetical protein
MWHHAVRLKFTEVSKERVAYVFRIEELTKHQRLATCFAYSSALKMEVIRSSEMTLNVYRATWRNIPEGASTFVVSLTKKCALFGAHETGHSCSTLLVNLPY